MIALISARGGSQRVPRKNVQDLCGHPLVAWSIVQAKWSHEISKVVLTTDDDEIADIGQQYGADIVIRRPVWDNGVTVGKAFLHACNELKRMDIDLGYRMVQLLPTSPLRKPYDIDGMVREARKVDALHMWPIIPLKEMVIYKNESPYQDRMGTSNLGMSYRMQSHIFNKFWEFSIFGSGSNVSKVEWLLEQWKASPEMDIEIDTGARDKPDPAMHWGYKVEEWQHYEVDYPEDLEMCRIMMDAMILKGRGIKVYEEDYFARIGNT
jgi:hypothetical protein